jgi:hypothetical protein
MKAPPLFCVVLLLLLLVLETARAANIESVSQVPEDMGDGFVTTRTYLKGTCSELSPTTTFSINGVDVTVECRQPEYRYVRQHVGNIPAEVRHVIDTFALTSSPAVLNATVQARLAALALEGELDPGRRRLLDILGGGAVGSLESPINSAQCSTNGLTVRSQGRRGWEAGISGALGGIPFLGGAAQGYENYDINTRIDCDNAQINSLRDGLVALRNYTADALEAQTSWDRNADSMFSSITNGLATVSFGEEIISRNVTSLALRLNDTVQALKMLTAQEISDYQSISNLTDYEFHQVAAKFQNEDERLFLVDWKYGNITERNIQAIANLTATDLKHYVSLMTLMLTYVDQLMNIIDSVKAEMDHLYALRVQTQQYWQGEARLLSDGFIPFTSRDAIRPLEINGELTIHRRVLYEQFYVNIQTGSGGSQTLHSYQISFYGNRDELEADNHDAYTFQRLIFFLGPSQCTRPVRLDTSTGLPEPEDDPTATNGACTMWIEVQERSCATPAAARPTFGWRIADPQRTPFDQQGTFQSQNEECDGVAPTQGPLMVFRGWDDFRSWFNSNICSRSLTVSAEPAQQAEFQIAFLLLGLLQYVPQNISACGAAPFPEVPSFGSDIETLLWNALDRLGDEFRYQMSVAVLNAHGASPRGLEHKVHGLVNFPTIDGMTRNQQLVQANARIRGTVTQRYIGVTPRTKPAYVAKRVIGDFGRARVVLNVNTTFALEHEIDAPDPGTTQIFYEGSLANGYSYVGDLEDEDGYLYDVPQSLAVFGENIDARAKTPGYLMFPPENVTLNDDVFNTFRRLYGGDMVPSDAALDIRRFAFARANKANGHPYCTLANDAGLPLNRTFSNARAASSPNGVLCDLMREFDLEERPVGQETWLVMKPTVWSYPFTVSYTGGLFVNHDGVSNCTLAVMSELGLAGYNLRMTNKGYSPIEQRVVSVSSAPECSIDERVTVAPGKTLDVTFAACTDAVATVYRRQPGSFVSWLPCQTFILNATDGQFVDTSERQIELTSNVVIGPDMDYARTATADHALFSLVTLAVGMVADMIQDDSGIQEELAEARNFSVPLAPFQPLYVPNFTQIADANTGNLYNVVSALADRVSDQTASIVSGQAAVLAAAEEVVNSTGQMRDTIAANEVLVDAIVDITKKIRGINFGNGDYVGDSYYPRDTMMGYGYADWTNIHTLWQSFLNCFHIDSGSGHTFLGDVVDGKPVLEAFAISVAEVIGQVVCIIFRLALFALTFGGPVYAVYWVARYGIRRWATKTATEEAAKYVPVRTSTSHTEMVASAVSRRGGGGSVSREYTEDL